MLEDQLDGRSSIDYSENPGAERQTRIPRSGPRPQRAVQIQVWPVTGQRPVKQRAGSVVKFGKLVAC